MTPKWLLATVAAILFAGACYVLGTWQWSRYVEKRTKVEAIETNYDAPPVRLDDALAAGPLTPERQWTHVVLDGAYTGGGELLVRNRSWEKVAGYEVVAPFRTEGSTVLVDRGWVRSAESASDLPDVLPPPTGPAQVMGWLRTGEVSLGRDLPEGQLASVNLDDARAQLPELGPEDVYVVLGSQVPEQEGAGTPTPLRRPEESLGPHQAYAVQWWMTMPAGLAFVVWALRRRAREEGLLAETGDADAPPRPRKVRIWDEEDA
jgi:cytochrome oxidase assembly protein ShyY1